MKVTCFLVLAFCLIQPIRAQQGIVSAGKDINYSNGSVSYSIGQVAFASLSSPAGNVNQGLQQPFQLNIVGTSDLQRNSLFLLYPNPANQNVFLQFSSEKNTIEAGDYYAMIYSMEGKLVISHKLIDDINTISISRLPSDTYFIQLWQAHKFIQSVSFTKTN